MAGPAGLGTRGSNSGGSSHQENRSPTCQESMRSMVGCMHVAVEGCMKRPRVPRRRVV